MFSTTGSFTVNLAVKSGLAFFIVYLAVTLSPFAVKPATSNLAFVSSVNVAVAVTLASRFSPFVSCLLLNWLKRFKFITFGAVYYISIAFVLHFHYKHCIIKNNQLALSDCFSSKI